MVSKRSVKAALKEYLGVTSKISDSDLIAKYKSHTKHNISTKKAQLQAIAKTLGIKVKSNMKRSELLQLVKHEFDGQFFKQKVGGGETPINSFGLSIKRAPLHDTAALKSRHSFVAPPPTSKVAQTAQATRQQTVQAKQTVQLIDAYQYAYLFNQNSKQFEVFQYMICPQGRFSVASQYVDVLCLVINILLADNQISNPVPSIEDLPQTIELCHQIVSQEVEEDLLKGGLSEPVILDILSFVISQTLWKWCFDTFKSTDMNDCITQLIISSNKKGNNDNNRKKQGGTTGNISFLQALKLCFGITKNAVVPIAYEWKLEPAERPIKLQDCLTVINPFGNPLNFILQRDDNFCLLNAYLTALFYSSGTRERIELELQKLDDTNALKEALKPLLEELNQQQQAVEIEASAREKFLAEQLEFNNKKKQVLDVLENRGEKYSDEYAEYQSITFPLTFEYFLTKEIDARKFKVPDLIFKLNELYGNESEIYQHPDKWRGNESGGIMLIADLLKKLNIPVYFVFVEDDDNFYTTPTYSKIFAKAKRGDFVITVSANLYPEIMEKIFMVPNAEYKSRSSIVKHTLFTGLLSKLCNCRITPVLKDGDEHIYVKRKHVSSKSNSNDLKYLDTIIEDDTYGFTLSGISTFIVGYAMSNVVGKGSHAYIFYMNRSKSLEERIKLAHKQGCFDRFAFTGHAFGAYTQVQKTGDDIKIDRYIYNGHSSPLVVVPCPPMKTAKPQWWPSTDFYYSYSVDGNACDWITDSPNDINPIIMTAIENKTYKDIYFRYNVGIRGNGWDRNNAIGVITSDVSASNNVKSLNTVQGLTLRSIVSVLDDLNAQRRRLPKQPQNSSIDVEVKQPQAPLRQIPASNYSVRLESLKAETLRPHIQDHMAISTLLTEWFGWESEEFVYLRDSNLIHEESSTFKVSHVNGVFNITSASGLTPVVPTVRSLVEWIAQNNDALITIKVGHIVKAISSIAKLYEVDLVRFGRLLGAPIATRTRASSTASKETFFTTAASRYMNRFALACHNVITSQVKRDKINNRDDVNTAIRHICQMIGRLMTMYLTQTEISNNFVLLIPGNNTNNEALLSLLDQNKAYPKYAKFWQQVNVLTKGGAKVKNHHKTEEKLTHNGRRYSLWTDSKQKKYIKVNGSFVRVKRGKVVA